MRLGVLKKVAKLRKRGLVKNLVFVIKFFLFSFLASMVLGLAVFFYYAKDLPRPERFTERKVALPTKIYDRTGEVLLYTIFGEERREVVSLDQISPYLKQAVIVTEDANFYRHWGLDPKAIVRAILVNLRVMRASQGASTISQQLIRSTFLTPKRTLERKVREVILTLELERRYSKDQILEWYLNQIPFGSNSYGVEAASQTFFSKRAKDLDLAESALLASLIQAPSYLSPYGEHKKELLTHKDYVLKRMAKLGYISLEQAQAAQAQELSFQKQLAPLKAPHFVVFLQKQLIEKYGREYLERGGLKVFSTLDAGLQELAEKLVKEGVQKNQASRAYNAALVAIDPRSGEILALVGSKGYFDEPHPKDCREGRTCLFEPEFDVATLGLRQPGSAFKPFVYATAFAKGYDDKYIVIDEETNFGIWGSKPYIPKNYDNRFRGAVTLRQALAQSLNVPSVKVFVWLAGIEESIKTAKSFGITTLKDSSFYGPSLVLGGGEVRLLDMVVGYGVFASKGFYNKPKALLKIEDKQGKIIGQEKTMPKRVLASDIALLISDVLADNEARTPIFGINSRLNLPGASVKTGTTQYYNDAWTVGYTDKIVVGVWAGNNDNSSSYNKPGVTLAAPIWRAFIEKAMTKQ